MSFRVAFDSVGSTQDEVIGRVRAGDGPGLYVVARRQAVGRGRLDHSWNSPEGGLYLSTVVALPAFEPGLVPIGVATTLSSALNTRYAIASWVKWPNDLLVSRPDGRAAKLAGILVDRVGGRDGREVLVVGVGLNAATERAQLPRAEAETVAILTELCGRLVEPEELEPVALGAVGRTVDLLSSIDGARALWGEARRAMRGLGRPVSVDGRPAGIARDLAYDGALVVEQGGERTTLRAGEVCWGGLA